MHLAIRLSVRHKSVVLHVLDSLYCRCSAPGLSGGHEDYHQEAIPPPCDVRWAATQGNSVTQFTKVTKVPRVTQLPKVTYMYIAVTVIFVCVHSCSV